MKVMGSMLRLGLLFLVCFVLAECQYDDIFDIPSEDGKVEDDSCECVDYFLCVNNTIRTTAGRRLIEVRLSECSGSLQVCCKRPDLLPADQVTTTTPAPISDTEVTTACGLRNPEGVDFTLTGAHDGETNFGEFPWVVALTRQERIEGNEKGLSVYECGGSLIHPQVVLTAAHCVSSMNIGDMKIRAGEWDTQTTKEPLSHQDRLVSEVIVHEQYDNDTLFNDVALVILQEPVIIDEHVNVVCLPSQGTNFDLTRCFTGGWGKDVFGKDGRYMVILKRRELPVVPQPRCLNALRKARLGPYFQLHESFICAGGEQGVDTCKGDGGSPLVCPLLDNPQYYQQAGIVAWGLGCGEAGVPGVYVNIAILRDWIDEKMTSKNFETSSYTFTKSN